MKTNKFLHWIVFAGLTLIVSGCYTYPTWNSPNSYQAIGNDEQLLIFLQFNKIARHPSLGILTYDVPKVYSVSHSQDVLIFKKHALLKHFKIHSKDNSAGPTFASYSSLIFGEEDAIYLYDSESMNYLGSLFIWENDYFKLLPITESDNFFIQHKINTAKMRGYQIEESLKKLSKKNGWNIYTKSNSNYINESYFVWNGVRYYMKVFTKKEDKDHFWINIDTTPEQKGFPILLKYSRDFKVLTQEEYDNLPRSNSGHRKGVWESL